MNHDFIATHDVIARYATNRLTADEEREFEAHLVDCSQCTGGVEAELALRQGLGGLASERVTAPVVAAGARRWTSGPWLQVAAALLLVIAGGLGVWLALTRSALNMVQQQREQQEQRAQEATETVAALTARVADLESRVGARPEPAAAGGILTNALLPATVLALTTVRGGNDAIDTFTLDRAERAPLVVLTVDVPPGEYSCTLKDGGGRDVWSGGRFRPSAQDQMVVAVERSLLADGRYTLEVHRLETGGQASLAARVSFQIASK